MSSILLLCALLSSAAALNIGLGLPSPSPAAPPPLRLADAFRAPFAGGPAPPRPSIGAMRDAAVRGAMASSLALALSTANPAFTAADVPAPSAAVERAGFSLVADSDQEKFLAERAKMKTQASFAAPSPVAAGRPGDRSLHPRAHATTARTRQTPLTHTQDTSGCRPPRKPRRSAEAPPPPPFAVRAGPGGHLHDRRADDRQEGHLHAGSRVPRPSPCSAPLEPDSSPSANLPSGGLWPHCDRLCGARARRRPPPPLPPSHIHPRRARSRPSPRRHR